MAIKNIFKTRPMKQITPQNISNPGEQGLNQLFGSKQSIKPISEEKSASKFTGLKKYLKRSI